MKDDESESCWNQYQMSGISYIFLMNMNLDGLESLNITIRFEGKRRWAMFWMGQNCHRPTRKITMVLQFYPQNDQMCPFVLQFWSKPIRTIWCNMISRKFKRVAQFCHVDTLWFLWKLFDGIDRYRWYDSTEAVWWDQPWGKHRKRCGKPMEKAVG